ncbi:hypothetical protein [Desulfosporosinus sp. SB140]|uniref:hypothetical protein n=1 Tax=Desulfosporosinus paludis TaxID=3115649 RepID=UPI00388E671F
MKKSMSKLLILLITLLMCFNALPVFAANGSNGDAVYRDGVYLIYDHAAILKYGSDGSNMVIETVGNGPVTYDNWTTFLGGHNYLGAFYNPSYQPASSILATAASLEAVPGLQYSWQGQMYVDSTAGSLITPEHITTLRCDGLVEYCYEYNNSRIWGCASAADSNWDISLKSNVSVHQSLGTNGYYYISPNVQCSQTSYTKLIKR